MAVDEPKKSLTTDDYFAPYWAALGKLVFAWNELHEELGLLFERVIQPATNGAALAAWRVTESDRMQRNMLRYAVDATAWEAVPGINPKGKDEILWILDKANALAEHRNNAVHSPYAVLVGPESGEVIPLDFFGHPRAKNLSGKDLLTEFEWVTERTRLLALHALHLQTTVFNPVLTLPDGVTVQLPLPNRPVLPERKPKSSRQGQHHQPQPK